MQLICNKQVLTAMITALLPSAENPSITLDIHSGVMPNVTSTYVFSSPAATKLASWTMYPGRYNAGFVAVSPGIAQLPGKPGPATAIGTGTATWFAVYGYIGGYYSAVIGSVTDQGLNIAPAYIDNVNIVSGQPVNLIHFGFKLST